MNFVRFSVALWSVRVAGTVVSHMIIKEMGGMAFQSLMFSFLISGVITMNVWLLIRHSLCLFVDP